MKFHLSGIFILLLNIPVFSQSIELMPHEDGLFGDVQFLKPLSKDYKWTLFSRTRLNTDYRNQNSILSALYVSYTLESGFGGTVLVAVSNTSSVSGAGIHFIKKNENFTIFAIPYVTFQDDPALNWFSIMRFYPAITDNLRLYSSLELFSVFNNGHVISVQRIRVGLQLNTFQFGIATNMQEIGEKTRYSGDYGLFIRKTFN